MPLSLHNILFKFIIEKGLNNNSHISKRLREINGKTFCIEATDIKKKYIFYVDNDKVIVDRKGTRKPDVIMKGDFITFFRLFRHKYDADSTLFSRKIRIQGDIKTSVFFKNLLEYL